MNPDVVLFWDDVHPTTAGHHEIARAAFDTITTPPASLSKALNIATRVFVDTGERGPIAGFIVTGDVAKRVLIRGIGPSLAANGVPNPLAENLLRSDVTDSVAKALSKEARLSEARERMVLLMVNEAALALSERVAENAESIDLAMVLGCGWAPHRGGPLSYAKERGTVAIVEAMKRLASFRGKRFEPCATLVAGLS